MLVQQDVCDTVDVIGKELKLASAIDGWSGKLEFLRSSPTLFVVDYLRQRKGLPRKLFVGIDEVDGIA